MRKLTSRADVKARSAVLQLKKRHVERLTRLPTKRMATACWAFIVAKRPALETAPLLDFSPLQAANMKIINRLSTKSCGPPGDSFNAWDSLRKPAVKPAAQVRILSGSAINPDSFRQCERPQTFSNELISTDSTLTPWKDPLKESGARAGRGHQPALNARPDE
jgi:hypothetical protein